MAETATVIEREGPKTLTEKLEEVLALIQEQKEDQVREILRTEKGLLHEACNSGSVDDVKSLLSRGVPLSDWNKSYLLPLHIAAIKNDITIAEVLLSHDPDIIDRPSKFGEVPLHFACMKGHLSMAKFLLKHKADIRTVDRCGNTVLHYAVSSNNPVLVEYLLEYTNLNQFINKTNEFKQSPIHRAAVLQCVEVIRVLVAYRARLSSKDKNGLTALDLVTILYNNERMTDLSHKECIISPEAYDKFKAPSSSNMYINHIRSGSFSSQTRRSIQSSVIGSTASLPVSDGVQRKRPSATQSKRPVNLTISNSSYTRQASGNSNYSSRSSEIYLRDKDHAERISQVLDKQTSIDAVEKALLDQTSYDPPIDLNCILPIEKFTVSLSNLSCQSKEHDMRFSINDKYWLLDQSEMLEFKLAASLSWSDSYPSGFIFVSPICFLSCRSKRTCEVTLTLPHSLHFPSEKHHKRIIIFFTNTINLETGVTSPSCRDFQRLAVSDLKINSDYVTFTTSIRYPSLFVVGVASPPQTSKGTLSMIQYPVLPMRCCLYVACPSEREEYVTNTEISLYVGMSLKTVDAAMQKYLLPHSFTLEEKRFVLYDQVLKVIGKAESDLSQWQLTRKGTGIFRYNQIALSSENEPDSLSMSHDQIYPLREIFAVECHNPDKELKCRLSVESEGKEIINMSITPYTPPIQASTLDPFSLHENVDPYFDHSSSSESISATLQTSYV